MNARRLRAMLAWIALAAVLALADLWVKTVVAEALRPGEVREITSYFNLVLAHNRGAAFSLLADASGWQRGFFALIAVAASGLILLLLWRKWHERLFCAGLALILGGALGNLHDRVVLGYVVDFVQLHAGDWYWPAFNVADSSITVGAALLILEGFLPRGDAKINE